MAGARGAKGLDIRQTRKCVHYYSRGCVRHYTCVRHNRVWAKPQTIKIKIYGTQNFDFLILT